MSSASFRYSSALIQLAIEEDCLDTVYNNFASFIQSYRESEELKKLLSLDIVSKKDKKQIIGALLKSETETIFKNFILLLIDRNRINEISLIFESFESLYYKEKDILFATVCSATKLTDKDKTNLVDKLTKKYKKTIMLTEELDKTILGGLVLHIDGKILDLSIKSKLDDLGNKLKQTKLS